jgi:hypothetical protein
MDPVTLIVTAQTVAAALAKRSGNTPAIEDAVRILKERVSGLLGDGDAANAEYILSRHAAAPDQWAPALEHELREAGAAKDTETVAAAQHLLTLADAAGARSGEYVINATNVSGAQFGDHNAQVNWFGFRPDRDEAER